MLRIVVTQPQYAHLVSLDSPLIFPTSRELNAKGREILSGAFKRNLQFFAEHVPKETAIEVDVDGDKAARELIGECCPAAYRELECGLIGDSIFRRGVWDEWKLYRLMDIWEAHKARF